MYTPEVEKKVESRLLAAYIADNVNFEKACMSGNSSLIMSIVTDEMEKNNLYTKGSKKLHDDIVRMINGKAKISQSVGSNILFFVWNSRMSGTGYGVLQN